MFSAYSKYTDIMIYLVSRIRNTFLVIYILMSSVVASSAPFATTARRTI